ncbi:hypothetical protein E2C01_042437 [Portunus trituberculatus]|uniref:RNA-directed DNA polymerase from transposon X-element n=1 Tax=Portunus trituberculatus TaxID=210409 RepID=A0A5B7FT26_PORTR|nr:hypothetical protein [Portunus trituberculatus]
MPSIKILRNDVFRVLADLNPRKAYGPDGAPHIILKYCTSVLAPCLAKLFQLYLSTSISPSCWKFAYIQSVPKEAKLLAPSTPVLVIPRYTFPRLFRDDQHFRKLTDHSGTPQNA